MFWVGWRRRGDDVCVGSFTLQETKIGVAIIGLDSNQNLFLLSTQWVGVRE